MLTDFLAESTAPDMPHRSCNTIFPSPIHCSVVRCIIPAILEPLRVLMLTLSPIVIAPRLCMRISGMPSQRKLEPTLHPWRRRNALTIGVQSKLLRRARTSSTPAKSQAGKGYLSRADLISWCELACPRVTLSSRQSVEAQDGRTGKKSEDNKDNRGQQQAGQPLL